MLVKPLRLVEQNFLRAACGYLRAEK